MIKSGALLDKTKARDLTRKRGERTGELGKSRSLPSLSHSHGGWISESHDRHSIGWCATESQFNSRPPQDAQRAAGQSSGGPVQRNYQSKFEDPSRWSHTKVGRVRVDEKGLVEHQLMRAHWQTRKYDHVWHGYSEPKRPHAMSDYTGWSKVYLG
mmetsp:Transcript_87866/g.138699  ORF Transcript_87866/g.138699 Transcript_87866/m.138699 type:complete len:155 (+) Transcript_87866:48-512(+)